MALNLNKIEKRNKADELIEEMQREEVASNSSKEIIKSLNKEVTEESVIDNIEKAIVTSVKAEKPKRKVGRPRRYKNISDQKTIHLATYLPEDYAEKLKRKAESANTTVSEYIAAILMKELKDN